MTSNAKPFKLREFAARYRRGSAAAVSSANPSIRSSHKSSARIAATVIFPKQSRGAGLAASGRE
jgi:hypothetical protein